MLFRGTFITLLQESILPYLSAGEKLCIYYILNCIYKNFSIVIGFPRAYLSRNWRAITRASNRRHPIATSGNWSPVVGNLWHSRVNCVRLNVFLFNVSLSYVKLIDWKTLLIFRSIFRTLLISKFVIDSIT